MQISDKERESGIRNDREFSSLSDSPAALGAGFGYNLFTAADEKVPLSVVPVNKKPQYLVFSNNSPYLVSKHGQLPVESSKAPRAARSWHPILPQIQGSLPLAGPLSFLQSA